MTLFCALSTHRAGALLQRGQTTGRQGDHCVCRSKQRRMPLKVALLQCTALSPASPAIRQRDCGALALRLEWVMCADRRPSPPLILYTRKRPVKERLANAFAIGSLAVDRTSAERLGSGEPRHGNRGWGPGGLITPGLASPVSRSDAGVPGRGVGGGAAALRGRSP